MGVDIGIDSRHQTLSGVSFPITNEAIKALKKFANGDLQYVQLRIGNCINIFYLIYLHLSHFWNECKFF